MDTLQELIYFCKEEKHMGALLLMGEWGCGKTYLIEKELSEALENTHKIVRISLLGIDSIDNLNAAVRKEWLLKCTPFLGKLEVERNKLKKGGDFFRALGGILGSLNPMSGNIASALVAVDPMEYIPLEPVIEDLHNKGEHKRVILVFDDLSRSKLDMNHLMGTINGYSENMGFTTIIVAEEAALKRVVKEDLYFFKIMKEKTISTTLQYVPDYKKVINNILNDSNWSSEQYKNFLIDNDSIIYDVFASDSSDHQNRISKYHNFRSLSCALRKFYKVYNTLMRHQVADVHKYLYSFITYIIVSRNGIFKNGQLCFDIEEKEILELYPEFQPEMLPDTILDCIEDAIWDETSIIDYYIEQAMKQGITDKQENESYPE